MVTPITLGDAFGNADRTENNARAFKSTLDANLDFFANAATLRVAGNLDQVLPMFERAFKENGDLAILNLFHLRNVRGGAGEREAFRICLKWIADNAPDMFNCIFTFIPEYGRWDDLLIFGAHGGVGYSVQNFIAEQLNEDMRNAMDGKSISLLAKWLPSENASSTATKIMARHRAHILRLVTRRYAVGSPVRCYRKVLAYLRGKINVVERAMSAQEWSAINYPAVPSRAMMNYRKAFRKRDGERFGKYMEDVQSGKSKINASAVFPHELIMRARSIYGDVGLDVLEAQWKSLPDYLDGQDVLVVADTSGSMNGDPLYVSIGLALYAAERNKGGFKNRFITFSAQPQFVQINPTDSLTRKIAAATFGSGYNTNLQAVFDLILTTALENHVPQEGMPTKIFVISDMQFDQADGSVQPPFVPTNWRPTEPTNFEMIKTKFADAGYAMPTLVFWNVRAVCGANPVTKHTNGAFLVSGLSPAIFKAALSASEFTVTPYELMLEVLNGEQYAQIAEAIQ